MPTANLVLAGFLISVAGLQVAQAPPQSFLDVEAWWYLPVSGVLVALTIRRPVPRDTDHRWYVLLLCLVSTFYVLAFTSVAGADPVLTQLVYWARIVFQGIAQLSLITLGRSFSLFPALYRIQTHYLYSVVRHPAYAAYMLADACYVYLQFSWWNAGVAVAAAVLFMVRAWIEESLLLRDQDYQRYVKSVPWRFFPGLL